MPAQRILLRLRMPQNRPPFQSERKIFLVAVILILSSFVLMGQFSNTVKKADDDQFWEFTAMFSEVYKEMKDRYVDDVDSKKLFEGALQGMFLTLDPHSQYMDPDIYSQLEKDTEGAFSGIGIHITLKDGVLTVIAPIPGSPAAKVGVRPWDRIVEIEGKKTEGITLIEAVKKLTGPSGTTVNIKIYREGEPELLPFTLVRKNIKVDSVYYKMLDDKIGYIRLTKFSDNAARDMRKALENFKEKGAKGVIVDLRFNTGGLLKEAVEVSNLFIGRGKVIVSTKGRIKNQNQDYRAEDDAVSDLPLVVLVNKASASASEIFAGAVKDHHRGIIVAPKGQRTFGKGSVQTIEELAHSFEKDNNGNYRPAAIRLTTAKYYTPSGVTIDKTGLTPDIWVEIPKGGEVDLLKHGMYGDPPTDEADSATTVSKFAWSKDPNSKDGGSTLTKQSGNPPQELENPGDKPEAPESESAVIEKKDKNTSTPDPKKIIPLDRAMFPDAEIEGQAKKAEAKKKTPADKFIDYQLETAKRLLHDYLDRGRDFMASDSGMPKSSQSRSDAKAKETAAQGDKDTKSVN